MMSLFERRLGDLLEFGHLTLRWVILVLVLMLVVRAVVSLLGRDPLNLSDRVMGILTVIALDLQALIGIGLWVFLRHDPKPPANQAQMLYEHPTMMLVVIILAHVANVLVKKEKRVPAMLTWLATAAVLGLAISRVMEFRVL